MMWMSMSTNWKSAAVQCNNYNTYAESILHAYCQSLKTASNSNTNASLIRNRDSQRCPKSHEKLGAPIYIGQWHDWKL